MRQIIGEAPEGGYTVDLTELSRILGVSQKDQRDF